MYNVSEEATGMYPGDVGPWGLFPSENFYFVVKYLKTKYSI